MRDALHQVAVAAEAPCAVAEDLLAVARRLHALGEREANGHRDALPERAGGDLHARHNAALGVPRAARSELAELAHLVEGEPAHPREVEERIDERRGVSAGEHQPVAVLPADLLGVEVQEVKPERHGKVCHAQRRSGVAGLGLLDHVGGEAADCVRGLPHLLFCVFHGTSSFR